ncbi:MAG: sulfatase-like hydrolase/transferase [Planctomycetota bacterium]
MPSNDESRPNVVAILTDDQGPWAMGCAGNGEIRTPNLDRLARTGTRFESLFCASPVCSPARASLLTGRIPSQHGVHDWLSGGNTTAEKRPGARLIEYLEGQTGYTDILAREGYTCGISGKWHLGDSHHAQKSFAYWEVHAGGGGPYYDAPMIVDGEHARVPGYVSDVITDNALRFLDEQKEQKDRQGGDAPFYLSVHYTAPHSPWDRANHPREIWDDYHDNCPFESTPDVPMHPWQVNSAPFGTPEKRREILAGYFAAVTAMDAGVGRILDRLEAEGWRENTLVFFTSDNGMNMGHHGVYGKGNGTFPQNMYDTSVKVPGLISRPGHVPEGAVEDGLWSHYDFRPTLVDYLGIDDAEAGTLPGVSFAPVLRGEGVAGLQSGDGGACAAKLPGRDDVVVCDEYGPVRMVRTREWKYVHRYPYGPHELYDLAGDPDEETNLVDSEEHAAKAVELKGRLESWFVKYVSPELDGTREPVTGKGQFDLAGPGGEGRPAFGANLHYLKTGERPGLGPKLAR